MLHTMPHLNNGIHQFIIKTVYVYATSTKFSKTGKKQNKVFCSHPLGEKQHSEDNTGSATGNDSMQAVNTVWAMRNRQQRKRRRSGEGGEEVRRLNLLLLPFLL